jgi:hypothetical protein
MFLFIVLILDSSIPEDETAGRVIFLCCLAKGLIIDNNHSWGDEE